MKTTFSQERQLGAFLHSTMFKVVDHFLDDAGSLVIHFAADERDAWVNSPSVVVSRRGAMKKLEC